MTIPAFARIFSGELVAYGDRLVLDADAPAPAPGSDLSDPARLAELLAIYAATFPAGDRRAIASLWAKQHFMTLLPPYLALALIAQQAIDIDLAAIGCTFDSDGTTRHIHLHNIGSAAAPDRDASRFVPLIHEHIEPMILALAAAGGVSRKVLWSNAGNILEFVVRRIESALGGNHAISDAVALLEAQRLPDGGSNPLFDAVRYTDKGGRRRRVCCIRYRIPGLDYCSTCPLSARD